MQDKRAYHKQAGHCTRCGDPFGGSRATAFMVWEYVVWQVLGDSIALCQDETVPVCEALRDRQRASRRDAGDHMQGLWPVDARARADARLENRTDLFDPLRPTGAPPSPAPKETNVRDVRLAVRDDATRRQALLERVSAKGAPSPRGSPSTFFKASSGIGANMTPDPRWLEILKASGWQTTAIASA